MTDNSALVRPFRGLRPAPGRATDVAAPPYDVVNEQEAREKADGKPHSFLHVSRAEIDFPAGTDAHSDAVYKKARANLDSMIAAGVLMRDEEPCYYAYRLVMGAHTQTGIVGAGSISEYDKNRIRRHELTRPDKEDDRVANMEALDAQTGPVMVTHKKDTRVKAVIDRAARSEPAADVTGDGNVQHTLWVIDDVSDIAELSAAFDAMDAIYIADGHHRSASASRVAAKRRSDASTGEESHEYFLIVTFPDDEVQILDYNRLVKDLNGLSAEDYLARIADAFTLDALDGPQRPAVARRFSMYLDGKWYGLGLKAPVPTDDPVAALDISVLTDRLLAPVLGIGDPRLDDRIQFVGGIRGMAGLQERVDSGEMAVAFALYPTSLADLMAVADANQVMPPKSTWFEPKLADGLVSLVLD
ncbi:MAG: DUF1015 domain-containing protein [Rhodospirillaceae bacterium]|nr:DUF1015 domain-containing protein [Rhodospirillaceae bacterium]